MDPKELADKQGRLQLLADDCITRAEASGWTDELRAEFKQVHNDLGQVHEMIDAVRQNATARAEAAEARGEKLSDALAIVPSARREAAVRDVEERGSMLRFLKWARGGFEAFNAEDRLAYQAEAESRALSLVDAEGGFLVPEELMRVIENARLSFGGMREVGQILRTRAGNPLNWPTNNDTANVGEIIAINAAHNELDPVFAEVTLGAFKYSSGIVRVPIELLQDEFMIDFEGWLGGTLGTRIARIHNTHQTVGVGTTEPEGVVPASTEGHVTAVTQVDTFLPTDLTALMHSLDEAYARVGTWMFNWGTLGILRGLADSTGNPIWNQVADGPNNTIYGRPWVINNDLPDPAADIVGPIIFGDMSKYLIREVLPIQLTRTTELYWANSQVGFLAISRMDSVLLDAGTAPVVNMTMGAAV